MPRIRSIKPEFWQDTRLARMPSLDRLVYLCLWSMADDEGRLEGDADTVHHFGFPREDSENVRGALANLREQGRIVCYEGSDGIPLVFLPTFAKHQRIDKPSPSKLEAPPKVTASSKIAPRTFVEPSENVPASRARAGSDQGSDQGAGIKDHGSGRDDVSDSTPKRSDPEPSAAGRALASATGSAIGPCEAQVSALRAAGWTEARVLAAVAEHGRPGVPPWEWTRLATGPATAAPGWVDHGPKPPDSGGARMLALAKERGDLAASLRAKAAGGVALTPTEGRLLSEAEAWLAKMGLRPPTNGAVPHA